MENFTVPKACTLLNVKLVVSEVTTSP